MIRDTLQLGEKLELEIDPRYFLATAEKAMRNDIVRALVELITNSDDSYGRLEEAGHETTGDIKVSIDRKRKGKKTVIQILDHAEGMDLEEMKKKLKRVGSMTSGFAESHGKRIRGLMGRGSRECVVFGSLTFQSIKDGMYSEIRIEKPIAFTPIAYRKASTVDRLELDIAEGNGTLITFEIEPDYRIPAHELLKNSLPKYYSIRDIVSSSTRHLFLSNCLGNNKTEIELIYEQPEGEVVYDNMFSVSGYPTAHAHFVLWKTNKRIPYEHNDDYCEGGILVKSNYAIHGITGFSRAVEHNPHFERYFGRLQCSYIDDLAIEYELLEQRNGVHPENNKVRIIDPLRTEALASNHPFTKALYKEVEVIIKKFLADDERASKYKEREIENEQTKKRLNKLASAAARFIKDNLERDSEPEDEETITLSEIPAGGLMVIPSGVRIPIGGEKRIYVYARPIQDEFERHIIVLCESDAIKLSSDNLTFTRRDDGVLYAPLAISGLKLQKKISIKFSWGSTIVYATASVVEDITEIKTVNEFNFEKTSYSVRVGKQKKIILIAEWPELIRGRVSIPLNFPKNEYCALSKNQVVMDYAQNSEKSYGRKVAVGTIMIRGISEGGPIVLTAQCGKKSAVTKIRVLPSQDLGTNLKIRLVEEDLGDNRAILVDNTIKINALNKVVNRYLGPAESDFPGQSSIHFRLMIAELVADTVARRVLELNARNTRYKEMDVTNFYREHQKLVNKFLPIAHALEIFDNDPELVKNT